MFLNVNEMMLLLFCYEMNTNSATRNRLTLIVERNRVVRPDARIWKLISTVKVVQKGGCHVFRGEKDAEHTVYY
jgi:hypothetical protein